MASERALKFTSFCGLSDSNAQLMSLRAISVGKIHD